jgi:ankyrin repeat protein
MTELTREQKEALGRMIIEGCKKGDVEIVKGCLKRGADPDVQVQDGDTSPRRPVLHWAAYHFNEKTLQALVDGGATLEARDDDGDTALFVAIRNSRTGAVECLMKNGADPLAQNYSKLVVLDVARGLRSDYDTYAATRDKIIKALTRDYGPPRESARAKAPEKSPAESAAAADARDDIQILKPLAFQPKKSGGLGFNL